MPNIYILLSLTILGSACAKETTTATPASSSPSLQEAKGPKGNAPTPLPDRDPALAKKLVGDGAVLLDVRSNAEWLIGHLDGANHIPVDDVESRLAEIAKLTGDDKNKAIVLYCRSGGRAGRTKTMLLKVGYTQVTNMGGIKDWPSE